MNKITLAQAKLKDTGRSNADHIKQLNQDLMTAIDMLASHKQHISDTLDQTAGHVAAVHAELVAA